MEYISYTVTIFDRNGSVISKDDHVLADLFDWLITYHPFPIYYELDRVTEKNGVFYSDFVMDFDSTKVL